MDLAPYEALYAFAVFALGALLLIQQGPVLEPEGAGRRKARTP